MLYKVTLVGTFILGPDDGYYWMEHAYPIVEAESREEAWAIGESLLGEQEPSHYCWNVICVDEL
jgi:hypothetical protein